MPFISQIGVIVLIACTVLIVIKSNRSLADAVTEGEHFVDEWEARARIKQELAMEREAYERAMKQEASQRFAGKGVAVFDEETKPETEDAVPQIVVSGGAVPQIAESVATVPKRKKIPDKYITLIRLDEYRNKLSEIRVDHFPFTIGRDDGNDLVLDDICVGRKHCLMEEDGGEIWLRDLGSANKLYANGQVYEELMLVNGMDVFVGNQEFMVAIAG